MTVKAVDQAWIEANRFTRQCEALKMRIKLDSTVCPGGVAIKGCPESGAVRRASMDLTRALAELRK